MTLAPTSPLPLDSLPCYWLCFIHMPSNTRHTHPQSLNFIPVAKPFMRSSQVRICAAFVDHESRYTSIFPRYTVATKYNLSSSITENNNHRTIMYEGQRVLSISVHTYWKRGKLGSYGDPGQRANKTIRMRAASDYFIKPMKRQPYRARPWRGVQ